MSHLHIPDGLLPVWLWLSGLVVALALVMFSLFMVRRMELRKKVPLIGMMSAMMLVGMNLEIIPIAYHVNLSVITAIILGPWLMVVTALIVNLLMAMVGHGGITVVGLNTIVIGAEGMLGYLLFSILKRLLKPGPAAAVSTVLALALSTCLMLFIVFVANVNLNVEAAHGLREILDAPTVNTFFDVFSVNKDFDFRLFAYAALGLGTLGWSIEAFVTAAAIKFITRVKPDMIA